MKTKQEAIEIRRVFAETGGNISETARRCGCVRGTVRSVLARNYENNCGRRHRHHEHPEDQMIEAVVMENLPDAMRSKKLRLTSSRIARIVQADGYKLSERQLMKRVAIVRRRINEKLPKPVFLELDAPRGAFQVDFGSFECFLNDVRTVVHGLIVSSAFSNACAVVACAGEDSASFFEGMEKCFELLGGVPPVLRFDNLAPAVFWDKKTRRMTEPFSRFVVHHGFRPEFCNPRSGWEKGNVENKVKYVRNNFFNPVNRSRFDDLDSLNAALAAFAVNDRSRIHYKKKRMIFELLESERPLFGKLRRPFGYVEQRVVSVDKQGFVQYRGNRYFTKHDNRADHVVIEATAERVNILDMEFKPIANHARAIGLNKRVQSMRDLALLLSAKPAAIPYVIEQPGDLRDKLRGVRSSDRVETIMQVLTNGASVSCVGKAQFRCEGYSPNLEKYDALAGLDEQTGRDHTIMQQVTARICNSGYGAGLG